MTGPVSRYDLYVRDPDMVEVAYLGPYRRLTADLRLMGVGGSVGTFEAEVGPDAPGLRHLFDGGDPVPGMGIVARAPGGRVVFSGFVDFGEVDRSPVGSAVLTCQTDDLILARSLAYPDPEVDILTSETATSEVVQDVREGPGGEMLAEYIAANIGPDAGVERRAYPWLTVPDAEDVGTSGVWKARDESLLDLANRIAANSGIVWRLRQADTGGAVQVDIWEPVQLDGVTFSRARGGVESVKVRYQNRAVEDVMVAAEVGEDRVRTRRVTTVPAGQFRREVWVSSSSTDLTDMRQVADQQLTEGAATASATVTLASVGGFGVDWDLGDIVTAADWASATVTGQVTAARLTHDPGMPHPRWETSIGDLDPTFPRAPAVDVRRLLNAYVAGQ